MDFSPFLLLLGLTLPPSVLQGADTAASARLTDGAFAAEGADWLARGAVRLSRGGSPRWDLGASKVIEGGLIQADNNDTYVVSVSEDGVTWTDVGAFEPASSPGLRTRSSRFHARGRFVRLRGEGGDGRYSVSELSLFAHRRDVWIALLGQPGLRVPFFFSWAALAFAGVIALCVTSARSSRPRAWAVGLALALFAAWVVRATLAAETIEASTIDWIRGVVAFTALMTVLRTLAFRRRAPVHRGLVTGVLGVCAALAVLCFLNLGRSQFRDAGRGAPTYLHHYDMRTYFPIAKYFPEVRFDGVYAASAAAVIEDVGLTPSLGRRTMTNLRTHAQPTIAASQEYIDEVRARFTPERWRAFVDDMAYFRRAMTDDGFLGTMNDHGGNATPVWFLGARLLFRDAPASDFTLFTGVAADVVLMLLAFTAIGWAFGARTALVAMIVWGAMDLYMFGSNWFGAALRHDWMALWAIGLALLKKERFASAGAVLAWAGLIRVFPIASFLTLAAPVAFALVTELREGRFVLREFLEAHRGFVRFCAGALAFGSLLLVASVAVFGLEAWPDWTRKILLMTGGRGINTVGLTNFLMRPLPLKLAMAGYVLATLWAARRSPLHEAAAFGVALVPALFSPMNYYLHGLYLLVVLGRERRIFPWVALLAMCVACYFTTLASGFEAHFDAEAADVLVTAAALIAWQLFRGRRAAVVDPGAPVVVPDRATGARSPA
jgi:hypothetical protein